MYRRKKCYVFMVLFKLGLEGRLVVMVRGQKTICVTQGPHKAGKTRMRV